MTVGIARKLSRTKPHREALLKNLVTQLLQHGTISSTHEKCKEASRLADRVINMAKKVNQMEDGRARDKYLSEIQSRLFLSGDNNHLLINLVNAIAPKYISRQGGYTRVIRLEPRLTDKACESILELVDTPILDKDGNLNKGNLKFWLLIKNVINDESQSKPYNDITIHNLQKMAKFKDRKQFETEILTVKRLLKGQANQFWDENSESGLVTLLVNQVYHTVLSSKGHSGYKFINERPLRPKST
ncbi:hypothetical protein KAFR_0C04170 [Kazachstania africana CBS 2517]|uniref:Large ribosomal subunit protein bL17m C-terminal fungi domain-containing protein n=1 Tax=Kazachstania africana (strain ATCC 22294 / BCRC 22015 / CBS 2517 / CECT 1963 / NBRC 1671 / NRRL Y-8276) TaxID=1071382 RepID=H2ASQ8_KAZAF|nr:hypothetical protein KAFR_0C04170 [Kazachstania africana CBS 2517]CCF57408.1 hypothetical protein KAFR_0C04170 [Kazachstania africana CBS 2517]